MSNKENSKKAIEQIAINLLEKNKSYNELLPEQYMKSIEHNPNNEIIKEKDDKEETTKDRISLVKKKYETLIENKTFIDRNKFDNKEKKNIYKKESINNLKYCTTINNPLTDYYYCCKKNSVRNSALSENEIEKNNKNNLSLIIKENKENKNININNIDNKINNNEINNDNLYLIKFITDFNQEINLEEYNRILRIYKYIMNNFNFISNKNNENNTFDIIQILSTEYINFILNGKINKILICFNYSIDIIKFLFYQIFIFLYIIYLDENKSLSESFEMPFKTLFLYSSQNFQLIIDLMSNPSSYANQEVKISKKFYGKNKIIFSIMKSLSPKKMSLNNKEDNLHIYNATYKLIEEIENETKLNRNIEIRNNIYNKLDKYLINLNTNEHLINKIKAIQQKYNKDKNNNNINIDEILNEINIDEDANNINNTTKKYFSLPKPTRETGEFDYQFSLFIELDETLVHYYEEGENYFVKVRQSTDEFLKKMHEFCELIIVSTSSKEYTDIILENLNKDKKYIDNAIYKEICESNNIEIDFRKINRDLKRCIFICHDIKDFFNAPERNVIELTEFNGEEEDKEILFLLEELMKFNIDTEYVDDIRKIISIIKVILKQRRKEGN